MNILKRPDERVQKALAGLEHNQEFKRVREWLQACLDDQDQKNRAITGTQEIGRGQGVSLAIADILNTADRAGDVLAGKR